MGRRHLPLTTAFVVQRTAWWSTQGGERVCSLAQLSPHFCQAAFLDATWPPPALQKSSLKGNGYSSEGLPMLVRSCRS